jgi:hypothetical protein
MKHGALCLVSTAVALVIAAAGCAGHAEQPASAAGQPVAAVAPAVAPAAAAATAKGPATRQVKVDASNVAEVQRAGYKVVNKDGEKLYCRTDPITGSRVQTHTQCLTEQELYDQINETQNLMSLTKHENPLGPK